MCLCMCICMYVCMYVFVYVSVYVYIHMCVCSCAPVCIPIYIYIYIHIYIHIYICIYIYVNSLSEIYLYLCTPACMHVRMYIRMYVHICLQKKHVLLPIKAARNRKVCLKSKDHSCYKCMHRFSCMKHAFNPSEQRDWTYLSYDMQSHMNVCSHTHSYLKSCKCILSHA